MFFANNIPGAYQTFRLYRSNFFANSEKEKGLMNIIQVNNWCRGRGGIEVVVESTTSLLEQRGIRVSSLSLDSRELAAGICGKVRAFASGFYSLSSRNLMHRLIKSGSVDIAHVHNIYPFVSPSVLPVCRKTPVPVVMSIHSYFLTCPTYYHLRNGKICEMCLGGKEYWCAIKNCRDNILESLSYALRSIVARKLRIFNENVTLFIALTEFAKARLVACSFPEDRIAVLPNMVAIPNSDIEPSIGEYASFVGRFSPEKGIETLLEAVQRLPQLPLRLAGDWSFMPQLVHKKPKNAEFVGFLDRAQLLAFHHKARFLVVPSKCFEMCPLVISEAMSHGLPVIASRIGGLAEIVDDGITGLLFEPGNAEELAEKMTLLWENPDLCRRMGQAGREKAIREYSEDVYYGRLMAVYKRAIRIHEAMKAHETADT